MKLKANRNISVSKGHGYDFQKVKFAMDFVNKAGRNTTIDDWVAAYNHIKGTNETATGCHKCAAAKYSASVRNYAQYGYLTLINFGYKPDDFKDQPKEAEVPVKEVVEETSPETCNGQEQVPELAEQVETPIEEQPETVAEQEVEKPKVVKRNKGGRPKKTKK